MNVKDVLLALRRHHPAPEWAFFEELRPATGFSEPGQEISGIDAFVMGTWESTTRLARVAYEIKVSRSDFLRELKHPEKRKPALEVSNRFYFAMPRGIAASEEVPADAGLVYITAGAEKVMIVKEAPWRDTPLPGPRFWAMILRRAAARGGAGCSVTAPAPAVE